MSGLFDHALVRRLIALALVLAVGWTLAPLILGPLATVLEQREQLDVERAILVRLGRLDERRAAVARLAAEPDAPFIVAADATAAIAVLTARVLSAVPAGAMDVTSFENEPPAETPGEPLRVRLALRATLGGIDAFLRDIETRHPFLSIETMKLSRLDAPSPLDPVIVVGSMTLAAVPLIRTAQ